MITRKLSKAQGYMVQGIANNLAQLQAKANEEQAALKELGELLRAHFGLPEGETQLAPGPDGWSIVVKPSPGKPEPGADEVEPKAEAEADDEPPPNVAQAA